MKKNNFEPYGDEWKNEMLKLSKSEIVELFKSKCQESENRGVFIDWCAKHHEEVLKEYTGF